MIKTLKEVVEKAAKKRKGDHAAAVVEIAETFGLSRSSVYRMLSEGKSFVYWNKDSPYPVLLRTAAVCVVS